MREEAPAASTSGKRPCVICKPREVPFQRSKTDVKHGWIDIGSSQSVCPQREDTPLAHATFRNPNDHLCSQQHCRFVRLYPRRRRGGGNHSPSGPGPLPGRRRRFTTEEKRHFIVEAMSAGQSMSSVGRRHGLSVSLLFRWRRQLDGERRTAASTQDQREPAHGAPGAARLRAHARALARSQDTRARSFAARDVAPRPQPGCCAPGTAGFLGTPLTPFTLGPPPPARGWA